MHTQNLMCPLCCTTVLIKTNNNDTINPTDTKAEDTKTGDEEDDTIAAVDATKTRGINITTIHRKHGTMDLPNGHTRNTALRQLLLLTTLHNTNMRLLVPASLVPMPHNQEPKLTWHTEFRRSHTNAFNTMTLQNPVDSTWYMD